MVAPTGQRRGNQRISATTNAIEMTRWKRAAQDETDPNNRHDVEKIDDDWR